MDLLLIKAHQVIVIAQFTGSFRWELCDDHMMSGHVFRGSVHDQVLTGCVVELMISIW